MAAVGSQLASVLPLSSAPKVSTSGSTRSSIMLPLRIGMPTIDCAKHAQKKAKVHHVKSRPKKHQPYDKNRQGPTLHPAVAKAPPIWGFDTGDVIPDVWDVRQPKEGLGINKGGYMLAISSGLDNAASSNFDEVDSVAADGDVISRAAGATGGAQLVSGKSSYGNSDMDVAEADREDNNVGGSDDGNGGFGGGDGGDGGGESGEEGNQDSEEFGPILNAEQVQQEVQRSGITLPPAMLEAAKTVGIRQLLLSRYIELQGAAWPLGPAIRGSSFLRNRMLADPTFIFKVLTEIAIDSGCATFAEVRKRGKDFWNEFELYLSDLSVGIVLDIALVGLLAPFVQFGAVSTGSGTKARLSRAIQGLPSSIFEAQRPGRVFSLQQRIGTLFFKAGQYGVAGFACGIVGQGLASGVMTLKRKLKNTEEEEVAVPSIVKTAALWAVFMGVSSNTRYQIINGLERVVEGSIISRRVPQIALAFTVGIRFANNIYGGMQFVDWARLAGVQ